MHYLFGSEIPEFPQIFQHYIKAKYGDELILQPIEKNGTPLTGVFIDTNSPNLAAIMQEKDEYLRQPFDTQYTDLLWQTENIMPPRLSPDFRQRIRLALRQPCQWRTLPKFTLFLTALCLIIYLLQYIGFDDHIMDMLHYPAFSAQDSEFWRYISHSLVHLSPCHIAFNLAWWYLFGGMIEQRFGTLRLLKIYLAAALLSGICQNYSSGPAFFGLSGVVYAVLGYVFIMDKRKCHGFDLPNGFFNMLLIGIVLGFISPYFGIRMGNTAHITGLLTGLALGYLDAKRKP